VTDIRRVAVFCGSNLELARNTKQARVRWGDCSPAAASVSFTADPASD